MRLRKISYIEKKGTPNEWKLEDLTLGGINLIVGKNATGKTRALNVIKYLATLVAGDNKPVFTSAHFNAEFVNNNNDVIVYSLEVEDAHVVHEQFKINGQILLERVRDGVGKIYTESTKQDIKFQTPDDTLAIVARRDKIQHSFFEPLYEWSKSVHHYSFGSPLGKDSLVSIKNNIVNDHQLQFDLMNKDMVVAAFNEGVKRFSEAFKGAIIKDMESIGYNISNIGIKPVSFSISDEISGPFLSLFVMEDGLNGEIDQTSISQGMFRALSVIIQINYAALTSKPSCILIDDIGEGLDFDRSCRMIELLVNKAKNDAIQLIMSTNDRFVMNSVPLENWTVLQRDGGTCRVSNYENSKDKFEEFKFTGLNNFDFFAIDFLNSEIIDE